VVGGTTSEVLEHVYPRRYRFESRLRVVERRSSLDQSPSWHRSSSDEPLGTAALVAGLGNVVACMHELGPQRRPIVAYTQRRLQVAEQLSGTNGCSRLRQPGVGRAEDPRARGDDCGGKPGVALDRGGQDKGVANHPWTDAHRRERDAPLLLLQEADTLGLRRQAPEVRGRRRHANIPANLVGRSVGSMVAEHQPAVACPIRRDHWKKDAAASDSLGNDTLSLRSRRVQKRDFQPANLDGAEVRERSQMGSELR